MYGSILEPSCHVWKASGTWFCCHEIDRCTDLSHLRGLGSRWLLGVLNIAPPHIRMCVAASFFGPQKMHRSVTTKICLPDMFF